MAISNVTAIRISGRRLRRAARGYFPFALLLLAGITALIGGYWAGRGGRKNARGDRLEVTVVNVQEGESSFIKTPDGKFIVIGAGPPGQGVHVAAEMLAAGATKIDLLCLPYPYAEAIGGVPELMDALPVSQVIEPGGPVLNRWDGAVRAAFATRKIPVHDVVAGSQFNFGGVLLTVIAPGSSRVIVAPAAANNSLVLRLRWRDVAFLWAGGIDRAGEAAMLGRTPSIASNWLRVARFGTAGATSAEFLRVVSPDTAVISVGPNQSGCPDPGTLARLAASGAVLFRTDEAGASLRFSTDGAHLVNPPIN